jgi:outer membrane lipoprotein
MKYFAVGGVVLLYCAAELLPAYAEDADIAQEETSRIHSSASFAEIAVNPEAYQGQEIVVGGKVITARQYYDTTQIEVMQLPLGPGQEPDLNEALTQGRFLAFQKAGLNPVGIPPGTRITVVGEVAGSAVPDPDQTAAAYPVLEVKSLTVWPASEVSPLRPAPAQLPPAAIAPVMPYPEPPVVIDRYYYTTYWDPVLSVWAWRPFWVYPWWARPAIVVPPGAFIRPHRRHSIPFGPPPRRVGPQPPHFVPRHAPVIPGPRHIVPRVPSRIEPNRIVPPQFNRRPPDGSHAIPPQFNRGQAETPRSMPPQFGRRPSDGSQAISPRFNHRPSEVPQAMPPQFNRGQTDTPRSMPPQFGRRAPDGPRGDFRGGNGNGPGRPGRGPRPG